ncbi:MAG TPA: MBL fold metallo-hydrolase [Methanocorpusculum sp.]|nr:MBL fold metallo-hydrolase [Methanocorpusculum sp.]HJK01593.1 MBL fold metallo-hydrolase [Methanocorpusculum sp.]HJK02270.1 MBL fold metallo-hydrolase [Methanocorpusculum sp.]
MCESIYWLKEVGWRANSYVSENILVDASQSVMTVAPYKDQIDVIVLTHGHFDHMANLPDLIDLCDAKVYIGERDFPFLFDDFLSLADHFGGRSPGISAVPLADGDRIGEFMIIHTPGHTGGSICLYREEDGALITGDTLFPHGSFGRTDLPTGNHVDLVTSINRLANLHIESLWCGHDIPVPSDAMRDVLLAQAEVSRYG